LPPGAPQAITLAIMLMIAFVPYAEGAAPDCQRSLGPNSQRVSAFLRLNERRYPLDGSISLDAGIVNKGTQPLFVYGWISWGFGGGLVIWVRNEQGQLVRPVLMDDTLLPPPT
jgi:hypothetical protein